MRMAKKYDKYALEAIIISVALVLASCGGERSRFTVNAAGIIVEDGSNSTSLARKSGQQLCGGYTDEREPSDEEYRLFRSVTDTMKGVSFTPLTVRIQVVAGINYRFYCRFSDGSEEYSPGHCWLTIYKPLPGQGEPKVTSLEKFK